MEPSLNAIAFTCPLPAMDIAMLVARVVPGAREYTLLAVVHPKTGPWLLSPAGTIHLVEHGGGKFTFVDSVSDAHSAARDLRVRQVLKGLGAAIAPPAPPTPLPPPELPGPPVGTVPVSGMAEAAPLPSAGPAVEPDPTTVAPAPVRPSFPAQRVSRRFNR